MGACLFFADFKIIVKSLFLATPKNISLENAFYGVLYFVTSKDKYNAIQGILALYK